MNDSERRAEMLSRVVRYETELRTEQSFCQPSQLLDRDSVPLQLGQYSDEQIDEIIALEREIVAQYRDQCLSSEDSLARALNRFNLL